MFASKATKEEVAQKLRALEDQIGSLVGRVNIMEAAYQTSGPAEDASGAEVRQLKDVVAKVETALKSMVGLLDGFKLMQRRNDEALRSLAAKLEELERRVREIPEPRG